MVNFMVNMWFPCRETQLRAFYSTTEEISNMFAKQQEQLKAMQRTLEDEENYENTSVEIDLNAAYGSMSGSPLRKKEARLNRSSSIDKAGSSSSAQRLKRNRVEASSDEDNVTEKHECSIRSQEGQNTQEVEFKGTESCVKGGFGSDICCGTEPLEGEAIETERVLETESLEGERNIDLNKCGTLAGDTLQLDDDANVDFNKENTSAGDTMQLDNEHHVQEKEEQNRAICGEIAHGSQSNNSEHLKELEDTEAGTIRTADLLASEVAGSWACSTAPSVHGENESPRSRDGEGAVAIHDSNSIVAESQSTPSSKAVYIRRNHERQALSEMIGIVAPELKDQFSGATGDFHDQRKPNSGSTSGSDTVDVTDDDDDDDGDNMMPAKGGSISDSETEGSDQVDAMDEDDEVTREDSLG